MYYLKDKKFKQNECLKSGNCTVHPHRLSSNKNRNTSTSPLVARQDVAIYALYF